MGSTHIYANKNSIPFDKRSPQVTSGLRVGTPALTSRGMGEPEMKTIADLIRKVLEKPGNEKVIMDTRSTVAELCKKFPIYDFLTNSQM